MLQTIYDFDLIRVYLDSSMSHPIAEKLARTYPKRVFGGIKTELVSLQNFEDVCKVPYMLGHYLTLHHHVIYIHLNILTHLCFEHLGHHPQYSNSPFT